MKKGAEPPACGKHISRALAFRAGWYRRHHRLSLTVGWDMPHPGKESFTVFYPARSYNYRQNAGSVP
jgi:hypothetical protein